MELKELAGKHTLDAVDFTDEKFKSWGDKFEYCQVCRFRLDGVTYMAAEDPDDGYRSSMRDLVIDGNANMKNAFAPVEVFARHRSKGEYCDKDDVLELIDAVTGGVILEVGTESVDDYYPVFVARYNPAAMATNR